MILDIPGRDQIRINNVILDFNGTIAIDGKLIDAVADKINALSHLVNFVVVTADTYGTVEKELADVDCKVVNLSHSTEFKNKLDVLVSLGKEVTLCVGNGFNDRIVLKESVLGISLLQEEGLNVESLMSSDLMCKSIIDVFDCIANPNRIKATLRS